MGWIHYDYVPDPPNTIDDLTNAQLIVIGDEYTADHNRYEAYVAAFNDPLFAEIQNIKFHVDWVYTTLDRVQIYCAQLMNGQVVINDDPLTYNTPPVDQADLNTQLDGIDDPYINELGPAKINYATTQMIAYSKGDGTGDWAYYSSAVTS